MFTLIYNISIPNHKRSMMRFRKLYLSALLLMLPFLLGGCSFLLPKLVQVHDASWDSFKEAKKSYNLVIPGQTTVKSLYALGFDPYKQHNVQIKNATDTSVIPL